MEGKSVKCTRHPDTNAVCICNKYLCQSVGLCQICKHNHDHVHLHELDETLEYFEKIQSLTEYIRKAKFLLNQVKQSFSANENLMIEEAKNAETAILNLENIIEVTKNELESISTSIKENKRVKENYKDFRIIRNELFVSLDNARNHIGKIDYYNFVRLIKDNFECILPYCNVRKQELALLNLRSLNTCKRNLPIDTVSSGEHHQYFGGPAVLRINGIIYMIGGFYEGKAMDAVCMLPIKDFNGEVIKLSSLKVPKYDIAAVHINKTHIYALTGTMLDTQEIHLTDCEKYNIKDNCWEFIKSLNVGRAASGSCTFNDRYIFVYGGQIDNSFSSNFLESYDSLDDEAGWKLYHSSEYSTIMRPTQSAVMHQISNNEIMIFGSSSIILKLNDQAEIANITFVKNQHYSVFYTPITVYNNSLYLKPEHESYICYDIIKRAFTKSDDFQPHYTFRFGFDQ